MSRVRLHLALALAALAGAAACSPVLSVNSTASPDARFGALHTFRIAPTPERRSDAPALAEADPMRNNSITNQRVRADLAQAFEAKGYRPDSTRPDFIVAFYAGAREKLDTTYWNWQPWRYRYWGMPGRWAWPYADVPPEYPRMQVDAFTEETVLVDVVDAATNQLLWRGQGNASVSSDAQRYAAELATTVDQIVQRFPAASAAATASRGGT